MSVKLLISSSVSAAQYLYDSTSADVTELSPIPLSAFKPDELAPIIENSPSEPLALELTKNLWLISSKLALSPASFNLATAVLTLSLPLSVIVFSVLLTLTDILLPSSIPSSDNLDEPVSFVLLPSLDLTTAPVR